MLDQTLFRCALIGCSILWAWPAVAWTDSPNGLHNGKLVNGSVFIHFNDGMKWFLLAICCALGLWLWARGQRPARAAPPAFPGALPLFGHALQLVGDELRLYKKIKEIGYFCLENGGVVSYSIGPYSLYIFTDPDDWNTVANSCLDKPQLGYSFLKQFFGNGLVTADVKTWKVHRKLLNPAFNQKTMNMFVDVFNRQSRWFVNQLRKEVGRGSFDPEHILMHYVMDTTFRATLDVTPDEDDPRCVDYVTATKHLGDVCLQRLQRIWLYPPFMYNLSSLKKKNDKFYKFVTDISNTILQKRRLELKEMGVFDMTSDDAADKCKTLLDLLLHLAAEQGVFTDSDIMDHLNTFIMASYETTGTSMLLALVLIGSHQDVQERVYKELQEVLGGTHENIDRHVLTKLVYLEAVLKESMRLYPAAPMIGRMTTHRDVKLKNYTIPAGAVAALSIYGIHRHPMWGADAEQFRPERWLEPGGVPDHPSAFAPFSIGRRNCIGKPYAMMSMKITLAHLLRRYHVTADVSKLILKWCPVTRPVSGHDISLEFRK